MRRCVLTLGLGFGITIWLGLLMLGFYAAFSITLAFLSFASRPDWIGTAAATLRKRTILGILGFAVICGSFLALMAPSWQDFRSWTWGTIALGGVALAGLLLSIALTWLTNAGSNYFWRRRFEVSAGHALVLTTLLLAVGSVPIVPYLIANHAGKVGGVLSAATGIAGGLFSAIFGHFTQSRRGGAGGAARVVAMIASGIFIYFMMVVAYLLAQLAVNTEELVATSAEGERLITGVIVFAIVLATFLGLLSNINHVGLHRFYRDRIMEAFMPSRRTVDAPNHKVVPSREADNLQLADLWPAPPVACPREVPYPLINTSVVLVNDGDPRRALRGGDNFILSPLFVGSAATGWQGTRDFVDRNGALTLASAMAASGAAVNANAAYAGSGTTRERLLSIVMTLLNIRLGLWTAAPSRRRRHYYRLFTPNHFHPGLTYGLLRLGHRADSGLVELTDGGHFDNIGLYELARRRCRLIVVVDSEADSATSMPALVSVVQRIQEDFGARIDLSPSVVDAIMPALGQGFPLGARYVRAPYFVTSIAYGPRPSDPTGPSETGTLVYVKSALIEDLDFAAKGYWAQNPSFPHQSTADQFFDPIQFEAYRQLGFRCMDAAIGGGALDSLGVSPGQAGPGAARPDSADAAGGPAPSRLGS